MIVRKSPLFLFILLPGLYVSDLLYGLLTFEGVSLPFTPGVIIRGGLFCIAVYVSIRYSKHIDPKSRLIVWLLVALSLPGFLQSTYAGFFFNELSFIIKVLYGPFLVLLFLYLIEKKITSTNSILVFIEYAAYFIGGSLYLMQLFQIGFRTYGVYTASFKGFFSAQNDISLSLMLAFCIVVYHNLARPRPIAFGLSIFAMLGLLGVGTRSSLIALVLIPILVIFVLLFSSSTSWKIGMKYRLIIFLTPILLSIVGVGLQGAYDKISESNYQLGRYEKLLYGELPRQRLIDAGISAINERSVVHDFIGEGGVLYFMRVYLFVDEHVLNSKRRPEVDWLELFGAYGVIFTLLIHSTLLVVLVYTARKFIALRKPEFGVFLIMILLYFGHSIFAGHALVSPIVNTIMSAVISIIISYRNQDRILQ